MEEKDGGWKGGAGGGGGLMVNQAESFKKVLATAQDGMGGLDVGSGEGGGRAVAPPPVQQDDNLASSITRQKVAAAKQYIENHYKSQMKSLQERKERYNSLLLVSSIYLLRRDSIAVECRFDGASFRLDPVPVEIYFLLLFVV